MRALAIAIFVLAAAATVAVAMPTYPLSPGSASFNMSSTSIGSLLTASTTYNKLEGILYEITGEIGAGNYRMCLGWYCPSAPLLTPYSLRVKGVLNYSTGDLVKNAKITVTTYNSTTSTTASVDGFTNDSGYFDITVSNIPSVLVDSGFAVRISAYGNVEAVFDKPCIYQLPQNEYRCG